MLLILAAAGVGGATWLWGLAGTGLVLTGAACMGIGYLARQRMAPLPHAPDTQPDSGHPIPEERVTPPPLNPYLKLNQEVAAIARKAPNLPQALHDIGQLLHTQLGSRSWICLRVEGWNGESSLLRPWTDTGSATSDMIDLTAFATTHKDDAPAGQALNRKQPTLASVAHARTDSTYPWREVGTGQILALPITTEGWPQALVEFSDPKDVSPSMMAVLEVAAIQLGFVAQRDANLARMASHAEHLGRLTLVASRISSGVAITDRDGTIEWINSAFIALTGWSEEQVIGRQLPDLLQQEAADGQTLSELREHIARGVPFRLSYEANRHTPQTITRYWGEIDAIQMLDESGGRSQYVCLFNDITRRKAQEHVREQEREFLEALLGHLPVSLFVLDAVTMNVVAINRYTEQEFDLQRDQVVGRPIDQAIGSTILNLARPHMQAAIASGQAVEHDLTFELDGSAPRVVNARHFALRHGNGSPRLLISLVRDITAARQAQADLEESERRFRELVESMDDAVYVADGLREHYLYLSPQITALLGMPPEEMQEAPGRIRTMVIPDDAAQMQQQEALERAGQPTDILVRMDIPERGQRWIRHRTRTRALPDGQRRIYGLVSDVTAEHTQALELQRTRDAAEAASKAKSQFMTNMSHEIRTPMNGILGMTELLLGTALNDKQRRFAQAVYRSGESLLEIINDILDFAKIEAGRIELASSDFVLRTVVEDTLELMAPRAHEKGLELNFREQPGLPSVIHGDPLRLRQILTNLVANAIKFTEHGEVVVDIRRALGGSSAQPGAANPPIDLEFMVRDTGIGIAPEMMPRLFTAFTQANSSMARRYGGTGLGLAISKQLVEMMGGHIEAHSAPAVGSEFVFRIPVHVGETQADMALLDEPGMPSLNVLVVDDNDTNRTVVENMLSAWGMRVTQATNGREAFDLLTADPQQDLNFDLALIDMNMPEMNGLELAD
ncbi:MAG TPA: ATP-binding protein, partial [Aquabacterium sp.]|nr:ATP-binding protein [Aquabacterium sp.]